MKSGKSLSYNLRTLEGIDNYDIVGQTLQGYFSENEDFYQDVYVELFPKLREEYNVTVNWDDDNNRDGKRVDGLGIKLKEEKGTEESVIIFNLEGDSDANVWKSKCMLMSQQFEGTGEHEQITGNAKYVSGTVDENCVTDDFKSEYEVDIKIEGKNIIINAKKTTPSLTMPNVNVKFKWEDEENKYNARPEKLKLTMYGDEVSFKEGEISAIDNWEYEFINLYINTYLRKTGPRSLNYTLQIPEVPNYKFEIKGDQYKGFEVIGTYFEPSSKEDEENNKTTGEVVENKKEEAIEDSKDNTPLLGTLESEKNKISITKEKGAILGIFILPISIFSAVIFKKKLLK